MIQFVSAEWPLLGEDPCVHSEPRGGDVGAYTASL